MHVPLSQNSVKMTYCGRDRCVSEIVLKSAFLLHANSIGSGRNALHSFSVLRLLRVQFCVRTSMSLCCSYICETPLGVSQLICRKKEKISGVFLLREFICCK